MWGYSIKCAHDMIVRNVHMENFRNHTCSNLEFGIGVNVLLGKNGQGKTNILEAISCLSLTKSFYAASDATLVQLGHEAFAVEGALADDAGIEHRVRVAYAKESGEKAFTINGTRSERLSSVIGMFPVVILSPENNAITFGPPSDRRRFIDLLLSQLSRTYFEDLLEYRQVLRQRNRMLGEMKQNNNIREDVLEPWNRSLAGYGARIICKRGSFVDEFGEYVKLSYARLVETGEEPDIQYASVPKVDSYKNIDQSTENILGELKKKQAEECKKGISLVGPHRDDFVFYLNRVDLQKYASQGQHKTFLIALKMAEFRYLKEKKDETPILLLDDVLSELDDDRSRQLLEHVAELGQTVITTTDATPFRDTIDWGNEDRKYHVEQGICTQINIGTGKEAAIGA